MDGSDPMGVCGLYARSTLISSIRILLWLRNRHDGVKPLSAPPSAETEAQARAARRSLLAKPDRLIGLILVGNNAVNISGGDNSQHAGDNYMSEKAAAPWVATASLTIMVLVFSEVTPKTIAAQNPEWFAFKASHVSKTLCCNS